MTELTERAADPAEDRRPAGSAPPAPGPAFLGRRRELTTLRADVGRAGLDTMAGRPAARARVLLIAGRPGTGRTALAREFARRVRAEGGCPDGVLRVVLTDPGGAAVPVERAARDLLGALGAAAPPGADAEESCEALRDALADRRVLLILDDAVSAQQVGELIPDNRDCLVLVVARGPLTGVADVRPCTVGALEQHAALRLLARGAGSTRVTVDPRAAERLAEACAHLPAALLLAGGWLAANPDAAVARATRAMTEPVPREPADPGDPPRQGGAGGSGTSPDPGDGPLDRAFRLAHSALRPPAARILRLLVLAPAGLVDAHIAAALAGSSVGAAHRALRGFALLGLVRPVESGTPPPAPPAPDGGSGGTGTAREPGSASGDEPWPLYEVPGCLDPLLRDLVRRHERPADVLLARARVLERAVRRLVACRAVTEPEGSPARERSAALPSPLRFSSRREAGRWLDSRLPSLSAAARLAVADGELDTLARRLIAALAAALTAHRGERAAAPELYRLHELVLDVAGRQGLAGERAAALLNLGDLDMATGRTAAALKRYRAALDALRGLGGLGVPPAMGRALESIAGTHAELGDWQRAADWYGRALVRAQETGDRDAEARLHGLLGAVHTDAGEWRPALLSWRAAAAAHRRRGDAVAYARSLAEVARVREYAGESEEALRAGYDALRAARGAGDRRLEAALRLRLAAGAQRLGLPADARAHRRAGEALLRECGSPEVGDPVEERPRALGARGDGVASEESARG
ncbi:NB-ARC domain-containing protein [Streptomyces sp. ST2-7A]|uniref:NB-ARC domain-containing protein n=1 Tax=Streptomyces sp. ST2-7A TaxID=2907214 RepID=UPI001F3D3E88|nr:NB-ARC domain-containing protein [Streptomyces sp. ST2-7A]MCE7080807.1 NB-ARC domain-containing protein [Streptomyces sp. ST2-7A]